MIFVERRFSTPSYGNSCKICLLTVSPWGSTHSPAGVLRTRSQPRAGSRISQLFKSGKKPRWPLRALGSAPARWPVPLAFPALARRPGETGVLTAGGRAPPRSARRKAPSSWAGSPRRSTAEPASAASYPVARGTCNRGEGGPRRQSGISISPHHRAPRVSACSNSLFNTKGISQFAKKKEKKKNHNFLWSLSALTYLGTSYCNRPFSKTTQAKKAPEGENDNTKKIRDVALKE